MNALKSLGIALGILAAIALFLVLFFAFMVLSMHHPWIWYATCGAIAIGVLWSKVHEYRGISGN